MYGNIAGWYSESGTVEPWPASSSSSSSSSAPSSFAPTVWLARAAWIYSSKHKDGVSECLIESKSRDCGAGVKDMVIDGSVRGRKWSLIWVEEFQGR